MIVTAYQTSEADHCRVFHWPKAFNYLYIHEWKHLLTSKLFMYVYMNNQSKRCWKKGKATTTTQQKGKATQHNSPKTVIFQRKIGCLRWDSNPRPSALQATLLPTKLPRQRISIWWTRSASQSDGQVNSKRTVHLGRGGFLSWLLWLSTPKISRPRQVIPYHVSLDYRRFPCRSILTIFKIGADGCSVFLCGFSHIIITCYIEVFTTLRWFNKCYVQTTLVKKKHHPELVQQLGFLGKLDELATYV